VDRGRIVETGRHEELMARGGAYSRLHRSQNNAAMDTGELRLPSFAEAGIPVGVPVGVPVAVAEGAAAGVGYGYSPAPVFVESWAPPQTYEPVYEPTYQPTYPPAYSQTCPQAYPQTEYPEYSDLLFGPMPTSLPDGRPLFRD
jgi:ATP-binding cassette subfamily B protein